MHQSINKKQYTNISFWKKITSSKASLVLDTAIILPLLILISYFMLSASLTVQHEVLMRYALDQTSKELSLLIPLLDGNVQELDERKFNEITSRIVDWDEDFKESLGDFASSVFLQVFLQKKVDKWLNEAANNLGVRIPDDERQIVLTMTSDHCLQVKMNYHIYTPWTKTERKAVTYIPLWTSSISHYQAGDKADDISNEDNIWSEHNFIRGKHFRDKYHANLPFNYPTICKYKNGEVLAVRSIDLTAPSYALESQVVQQITYEINKLNDFEGSNRDTGLDSGIICSRDILAKKLVIVIPGNSSYHQTSPMFYDLKQEATQYNITLQFDIHGNSYCYQSESGSEN